MNNKQLNNNDLKILTREVTELARTIGNSVKAEIQQLEQNDIHEKQQNDFVTYVDKASEETLVQKLRQLFPEAGFLTEEGTATEQKDYRWIIDPLDGTTNFIHQVPVFSISIALQYKDQTLLGVIYEPNFEECFYSWQGHPVFVNDKEIKVSTNNRIEESLIATGFPYQKDEKMKNIMSLMETLLNRSHGIRRLGSAALDLAWVAAGRFDAFYEYGLNPWDVAAGQFLVSQAGGQVSDFSGNDNFLFGKEILATNTQIHKLILEILQKHLKDIDR
jgi:myo-inositol-1(or 4)-monophosphatase